MIYDESVNFVPVIRHGDTKRRRNSKDGESYFYNVKNLLGNLFTVEQIFKLVEWNCEENDASDEIERMDKIGLIDHLIHWMQKKGFKIEMDDLMFRKLKNAGNDDFMSWFYAYVRDADEEEFVDEMEESDSATSQEEDVDDYVEIVDAMESANDANREKSKNIIKSSIKANSCKSRICEKEA
jgi:hypothetical protein